MHKDARDDALRGALGILARRALSEAELRTRLERAGHEGGAIDKAVARLRGWGYLDDAQLSARTVEQAADGGRGPAWVNRRLAARGVEEALVEEATARVAAGARERAAALLEARFGPPHALDPLERRRAARFLVARGFEPECVAELLGGEG